VSPAGAQQQSVAGHGSARMKTKSSFRSAEVLASSEAERIKI